MKKPIALLMLVSSLNAASQTDSIPKKKRKVYLSWGYTRAWYSRSDIHLVNESNAYNPITGRTDDYNFTLYHAKAHDRPEFEKIRDVVNITIPQFVFRVGVKLNDKIGIELNYDHTKYIVYDYQKVHIRGQFNDHYVDQDTVLEATHLLHLEHSDGANFWMVNLVREFHMLKKRAVSASWVLKQGGGVVIPRTDVTLFGQRLNNNWKLAGFIVGIESGLRVETFRHFLFEFTGKQTFADYTNFFVLGKRHGRGNQHFFTSQLTATIGYRFGRQ